MVFFNWATMQMAAKIVYYGPGLCGKTSNLSYIYAKTSPNSRGEMVSLETESERTLFFDLLPIEVGTIGGFKTRLQLYTVPGQVFYNTTRKLVLKGVDGLVFVADSQRPMRDANIESFKSLVDNLKEFGLEVSDVPIVLQFNKRDLNNVLSLDELNADLNPNGAFSYFEASAVNGEGVITTLKAITKITLKQLRSKMAAPETPARPGKLGTPSVRPVRPPKPAPSISAESLLSAAEEGVGSNQGQASPPAVEAEPSREAAAAAETEAPPAAAPGDKPESEQPAAAAPLEEPEPWSAAAPPKEEPEPWSAAAPPEEREPVLVDELEGPKAAEATSEPAARLEAQPFEPPPAADVGQEQPAVKRVQVSNQFDILAELDNLRQRATMANGTKEIAPPNAASDDVVEAPGDGLTRELTSNVEKSLNSDIFKNMRGMQLAIRIQNEHGDTIHTLDPVSLDVDDAAALRRLCLRFELDLENLP